LMNHSIIMDSGDELVFVHLWEYYNEYDREVTRVNFRKI
jgi:hypothetical protein